MKRKPKEETRWAQLPEIERAYMRVKAADKGGYSALTKRFREIESTREKRERNTYYQLLKHWCDLKKKADAQRA